MDAETKPRKGTWRRVAATVAAVIVLVLAVALLLVLTGITAEPETLIEGVVRAVIGR